MRVPLGDVFARVEQPSSDGRGQMPHTENREKTQRDHQGQQWNNQDVGGDASERNAMEINSHGQRETDLYGCGDDGEFVGVKADSRGERKAALPPRARQWKVITGLFTHKSQ